MTTRWRIGGVVARVNKRSHEVMEEAMYSKYGLATGRISAGENRDILWWLANMGHCCQGERLESWAGDNKGE